MNHRFDFSPRHSKLKDEIIQDHQNVERAFNDLSQKYERTRSVVVGLQEQEEDLKKKVEDLSQKHTQKEELFEQTKEKVKKELSQAEMKLFEKKTNGEGEIARLRALLKKAEMSVTSLEAEIQQKTQENKEMVELCDNLLLKLDTSS